MVGFFKKISYFVILKKWCFCSVHSRIFFTGALWPLPKKKMGPSQKNKGH